MFVNNEDEDHPLIVSGDFFSERKAWPLSYNEVIEIFECDMLVTIIMIDDIIQLICKILG